MKKIIMLLAIGLFPFISFAQVDQVDFDTYQAARKELKELPKKLKDLEKAFKSTEDSLLNVLNSIEKVTLPENPDAYCEQLKNDSIVLNDSIAAKEKSIQEAKQNQTEFSKVKSQNDINKGSRDSLLMKVMVPSMNFPLCFRFNKTNIAMTNSEKLGDVFTENAEFNEEYARYKHLLDNYVNYNNEIISIFRNAINDIPKTEKSEEAKFEQTALAELEKKDPMTEFKDKIDLEFYRSSYGKDVLLKQENGEKVESIPYLDDAIYEFRIRTNVTEKFLNELIDKLTPR